MRRLMVEGGVPTNDHGSTCVGEVEPGQSKWRSTLECEDTNDRSTP